MLDDPEFRARCFFPRPDVAPPPPGAVDHRVDVDGASLHLRLHPARGRSRGLVLLFHGNGEVVSDWDAAAGSFAQRGLRFAVVDYRGYGGSTGEPHMAHVIGDAMPVYAYARALGDPGIVVMGRSLGSAAAWDVAARAPEGMLGLVVDSGFWDVDAFARRRGYEPAEVSEDERALLDARPRIARITTPTLLLHGELDAAISIHEAEHALALLGAREKRLARIVGRGHNDLAVDRSYWEALGPFLEAVAVG